MGGLLEIGIKMRKCLIFTMRGCFRSVCNHPFLVCMLCVLIFMYRSSPFVFSLFVSVSPVLVCTAVLLGTLLLFGQPNIPEIEEEKITQEAVSLKTGVSKDSIVVEQNESHCVERYSEKGRDKVEQSTGESSFSASKIEEICRENSANGTSVLIKERQEGTELENGENWDANRELDDMMQKEKTEWNEERLSDGEILENQYAAMPKMDDEHLESDSEKSEADSYDSERVNVDTLDSPRRSSWKQVEHHEEDEEEDDALDSGSDLAESSSPDASMADIMPMLDELHPLLDEEGPQPVQVSCAGSDTVSEQSPRSSAVSDSASEQSPQSSTSSDELADEIENHEDSDVADDDNEDGEDDDDDDVQGDKDDETKSVITWTEEDQKNLNDLGSSEIERNQRLENLILRRRTRKNMSMVPEINLIDLESSDFQFHIAPISTTRQNPFDVPQDSYDNSGLPPIPGSAPSILLPRRNPFDIPYDSSEGVPNLEFQEELKATLQSREPFFKRHESFSVGPSVIAPNRQEREDVKLRPYFVPERMVSEESSYSIHRQSSELSDSKASSVPETESVSSVDDLEDHKHEEDDDPRAPELISETKHVTGNVGHGSQSSEEEVRLVLGQVEKKDIAVEDIKSQSHDVKDRYEEASISQPVEVSRGSSTSSLSEVSERAFTDRNGENSSMLDTRRDRVAVEPDISRQTSIDITDLNIISTDDVSHKGPVYDSSPPGGKNFSSSSSSSDVHAESEPGFPPVLVKRTVSESLDLDKYNPTNNGMLPEPAKLHPADEPESTQVDSNLRAHDNINSDCSGAGQRSENQGASQVPGVLSNSSPEVSLEENFMHQRNEGQVLDKSVEEKHLPISERESPIRVRVQRVEGQQGAEHSIDKGDTVVSPHSGADYHETNGKLMSTPSARGGTSLFYHEPDFEHVNEVQVPNTPVDSFEHVRSIQNLHIPIHELSHDVSSNIKSPSAPDSVSRLEGTSHVNMQPVVEEADEIKEIDEGISSELDSVGDFRTTQAGSGSHEMEKHRDPVGERLSSAHCAETSSTNTVEVDPVEVNKIGHGKHLGNSRNEIHIDREGTKFISEQQTSQTSIYGDKRDSTNQTSEETMHHEENKAEPASSVLNRDNKDRASNSVEDKVMVGSAEVSHHDQVDLDTVRAIPEPEFHDKEIEKPMVLDPSRAERVIGETISEHSEQETVHINTSALDATRETPVPEVRPIDNTASDHNQVSDGNSEKELKPNPSNGSTEVKAETLDSAVGQESSAREVTSVAAVTPDHEVGRPKDLHSTTSAKVKAKRSKSSSSSSSSSSSDSD